MADKNSQVLLDALLADRAKSLPQTPEDQAFELFAFEQCLKDDDLSPDELSNGQVGGGDDGGIDGVYVFLNGNLVEPDSEVLDPAFDLKGIRSNPQIRLVVVQAKTTPSFSETAIDKLSASFDRFLDLTKTEDELRALFSDQIIERFEIFRGLWRKLAIKHPVIQVDSFYATRGDTGSVNAKVTTRADELEQQVSHVGTRVSGTTALVGARELLDAAARQKTYTLELDFEEAATPDSGHVLLVTLDSYYSFIAENDSLRSHVFDWNVRDYEGAVEVNQEITAALSNPTAPEFWWLNNGVTVICSQASSSSKTFSLTDVQIVNGLQTSVTIYQYLRGASADDPARKRMVLVRVIETDDHAVRDQVIRATNRQTAVPAASLRATDAIQRDIEQFFLNHAWYYERRKNYYRNQGKPSAKTVTISYLAQAIMAIGLSEPGNSRARPSSLLKRQQDYDRIFDPSLAIGVYLWVAQVQKRVDSYLLTSTARTTSAERTNLRFYVSMLVVAQHVGSVIHSPKQLGRFTGRTITDEEIRRALTSVRHRFTIYKKAHNYTDDKIVKGSEFGAEIIANLNKTLKSKRP